MSLNASKEALCAAPSIQVDPAICGESGNRTRQTSQAKSGRKILPAHVDRPSTSLVIIVVNFLLVFNSSCLLAYFPCPGGRATGMSKSTEILGGSDDLDLQRADSYASGLTGGQSGDRYSDNGRSQSEQQQRPNQLQTSSNLCVAERPSQTVDSEGS